MARGPGAGGGVMDNTWQLVALEAFLLIILVLWFVGRRP